MPIWFYLQGFTAAQLSTEPVGKILAEEPTAGGIDIGEAFKLLIWMSVSLLVLMVFRLIHSKSLVSSQLLSNCWSIQNINCWRPARRETSSSWRRLSTCIHILSTAETLMVRFHLFYLFLFLKKKFISRVSDCLLSLLSRQIQISPFTMQRKVKSRYLDGNICIFFASRVNWVNS